MDVKTPVKKNRNIRKKLTVLLVFLLVVLIALGIIYYYFSQFNTKDTVVKTPDKTLTKELSLLNKRIDDLHLTQKDTLTQFNQKLDELSNPTEEQLIPLNETPQPLLSVETQIARPNNIQCPPCNKENDSALLLIMMMKLAVELQSEAPFLDQINLVLSLLDDDETKKLLQQVKSYAKVGIPTIETISGEFDKEIYKAVYLNYLNQQSGLYNKFKYYLLNVVFVRHTQHDIELGIIGQLDRVSMYLNKGEAVDAYKSFLQIDTDVYSALMWIDTLQQRLDADEMISVLMEAIESYIK